MSQKQNTVEIMEDGAYWNRLRKQQLYKLWHLRLGHLGNTVCIGTQGCTTGMPDILNKHPFRFCNECAYSKTHKLPGNKTEWKPNGYGQPFYIYYVFMGASNLQYGKKSKMTIL